MGLGRGKVEASITARMCVRARRVKSRNTEHRGVIRVPLSTTTSAAQRSAEACKDINHRASIAIHGTCREASSRLSCHTSCHRMATRTSSADTSSAWMGRRG